MTFSCRQMSRSAHRRWRVYFSSSHRQMSSHHSNDFLPMSVKRLLTTTEWPRSADNQRTRTGRKELFAETFFVHSVKWSRDYLQTHNASRTGTISWEGEWTRSIQADSVLYISFPTDNLWMMGLNDKKVLSIILRAWFFRVFFVCFLSGFL